MNWQALLWGMLGGAITATLIVVLAIVTVRSAVRRALGPLAGMGAMMRAPSVNVFSGVEPPPVPTQADLEAAGLVAEDK